MKQFNLHSTSTLFRSHIYLFFGLLIHGLLMIFLQFTAWPEMLIYPYLLERGFKFYGDIVQPYVPVLPYFLWGSFKIIGLSLQSLHVITIAFALMSDVFLYVVLKTYFKKISVITVLLSFILMQVFMEGNGLWFDHAVVPCILVATYFFLKYFKTQNIKPLVVTSIVIGLGFTIKQTAIWYFVALEAFLLYKSRFKEAIISTVSFIIPFTVLFVAFNPVDLFSWTIIYPFMKMPRLPGYLLYPHIRPLLITLFIFSPLLFLFKNKELLARISLVGFLASLGFLVPRFAYFHFQPALPFSSLSVG